MKKVFLVVVFTILLTIFVFSGSPPQNPFIHTEYDHNYIPDYKLTKAEIIEDLDYIFHLVDTVHGSPYRTISRVDFIRKLNEQKEKIKALKSKEISAIDAWYYLQELAVLINDGHTKINYPVFYSRTLKGFFPLVIDVINNKMIIVGNASDIKIPEYSELVSINGKSTQDMIPELLQFISGARHEYRASKLMSIFNMFLQTYYKMYPTWEIEFKYNGDIYKVKVKETTYEKIIANNIYNFLPHEKIFKINQEEYPILVVNNFSFGSKAAYENYIRKFFKKHHNKKYLIIDLRDNDGGDAERAIFILKFLITEDFKIVNGFTQKISKEYKRYGRYLIWKMLYQRNIPRILWWLPLYKKTSYRTHLNQVFKATSGETIHTTEEQLMKTPVDSEYRFKGKVFLLVSRRTFSSGVLFASIFREYKVGTIIGEETGGVLDHSSNPLFFELSNSKFRAVIPVAFLDLFGENNSRGLVPDIEVKYEIEDYKNKIDKELEVIKKLK